MTDRILLSRIAVYAYHGVFPEEERLGQRFYISIDARLDLKPAGTSDDWHKTASYDQIAEIVVKVSTGQRFHLIEALAERVASQILERFAIITSVLVRVEKPAAPIPTILDGVTIEIERSRDG
ncbi:MULTISPECIES: dihydroneopterin aldolase [Hyphomicrobiales]|uniref:7,8-dihydroneopterin aldolase n=2 Tax=Prosthecodimorpha TaxID=2981530 RepID=A0A0N8GEK5_9HYPH|nr:MULTISPECIES: dihydroneopterin aldolase [Hyphomicrobiales]KPL51777.1 dienelactone hydrolase [Prosthecomicrobium hirschii]MBT9290645.1 dihydroneopterin aldolase [Prosthecodimorpha staleyi]MCW1843920.1 dihydroneopterin aldolase [Prosthecomicrobium hirschii]TPQ51695.1 dihydroneopterin aldolase [Prosthecomicrobium hirschii]